MADSEPNTKRNEVGGKSRTPLRILLVGLSDDLATAVAALAQASAVVDAVLRAAAPGEAAERLSRGEANCVFINPSAFDWRSTRELLRLCAATFPVCLVGKSAQLMKLDGVSSDWQRRLRNYYQLSSDIAASSLAGELQYVVRGCHTYLLKQIIRANVRQIAVMATSAPAAQLVETANETEHALEAIERSERGELELAMGLNSAQMRAIFDETLSDARASARRGQASHLVALGVGLLVISVSVLVSLIRTGADLWALATGGMGAAAAIAALVTSPRRSIENGASRLLFIQTAYFSFLTQVRLLGVPGNPPLGYTKVRDRPGFRGAGKAVPDPVRFPLVQRVWRELLQGGVTVSEVWRRATTEWGLTSRPTAARPARPPTLSNFYQLLSSPFYCREIVRDGEVYLGEHEPMVTRAEFLQAGRASPMLAFPM